MFLEQCNDAPVIVYAILDHPPAQLHSLIQR
jgi:hypothetical protein